MTDENKGKGTAIVVTTPIAPGAGQAVVGSLRREYTTDIAGGLGTQMHHFSWPIIP